MSRKRWKIFHEGLPALKFGPAYFPESLIGNNLYIYIYNQVAYIWTYWHGCGVESVRNLVVSVPCLTCRTARTFTTLARRGTYLTPQLRVKCFIYTSQEHKIYPCVFGKRSLPVITSLLMQSGRTASYPFSFPQSLWEFMLSLELMWSLDHS